MNDNDFKKIWKLSHQSELVTIEESSLLHDLSLKMEELDKTIKKRNLRELVFAIALIIFFSFIAYTAPYTPTKIASLLIIPYFFFYIYKIKRVRRQKNNDLSEPPKQFLVAQKKYLQKEKKLLDTVLYWAILPLIPILILFYAGFSMDPSSYLKYGIFTLLILAAVYWANKFAAKKAYLPLIKKLDTLINEFSKNE